MIGVYKVSQRLRFEIDDYEEILVQEVEANSENLSTNFHRSEDLQKVKSMYQKLLQVKNDESMKPFARKVLELKKITKKTELGIIADSYDLKLSNSELDSILAIVQP